MDKYIQNQEILNGELDDNQVMMDIEQGKYFGLNSVGKTVWDYITEPRTFMEITSYLLGKYSVKEEDCVRDVKLFLDNAVKSHIILKQ